jgi:hypothetical protein
MVLAAGLLLIVSGTAHAAKPTKSQFSTVSANAFWYLEEQLSPTTHRSTVWYVGIYQETEFTFSDLYKDVTTCRTSPRGERCDYESAYGFSDFSEPGQVFTIDSTELTQAHIDSTYTLEVYDSRGAPTGSTFTAHIVTDFEGIGTLQTSKETYTFRSQCYTFRSKGDSISRQAEATGVINGTLDLGETYDAWLGAFSTTTFEKTC